MPTSEKLSRIPLSIVNRYVATCSVLVLTSGNETVTLGIQSFLGETEDIVTKSKD